MVTLTPNPSFSVTLRVQMPNQVGMLSQAIQAIADAGGNVGNIELVEQARTHTLRVITVDASSSDHADEVVNAVKALDDITVLAASDRTVLLLKTSGTTSRGKALTPFAQPYEAAGRGRTFRV